MVTYRLRTQLNNVRDCVVFEASGDWEALGVHGAHIGAFLRKARDLHGEGWDLPRNYSADLFTITDEGSIRDISNDSFTTREIKLLISQL